MDEPAIGSVVLDITGEAFQRTEDGYWKSATRRSYGWRYLEQTFGPLTVIHETEGTEKT